MPTRESLFSHALAKKYDDAIHDKELLSMRKDLAMLEVRLAELLERSNGGERPECWQELKKWFGKYKISIEHGHVADMKMAELAMDEIFNTVDEDYKVWDQIMDLLELRRRIDETEQKRMQAMNQFITAEDAAKLIAELLNAVRTHVMSGKPPEQMFKDIAYEFRVKVGGFDRPIPPGSGDDSGPASGSGGVDQA